MPKLTLRDLFAVVTIVALALGWWVDRSRLNSEHRAELARLREENDRLAFEVASLSGDLKRTGHGVTITKKPGVVTIRKWP